ncbi:MAG: class I adenylate-forming enzyme family protein [Hydrogenophaga sp.]|uniref:class I adenylate-forming enzyme family protein n=1 Tax=Hydrogenophaga sp. TaxID=1904254 RepID=UPI003D0B5E46
MKPQPIASFDALLDQLAGQPPRRPALRWFEPGNQVADARWGSLSGPELARRVAVMAACLTQAGLKPGDRVAWLGLNHPAQMALLMALARLGGVMVPMNHRLSAAEWGALLDDCSPALLVHDDPFAEAAQALRLPRLSVHALEEHADTGPTQAIADAERRPALLVYTSGTTGRPRGAVHTQGNLLANMAIAAQVQQMTQQDTVLTALPLFHVGGLCIQTLPALWVGAQVLLFTRFDAAATLACIRQERPTLTLHVPATLQALVGHPQWAETDLSSLRAIWAGSSLLPTPLIAACHARGVPVCNVYGSTETGPFSIALPSVHALDHIGSCGWPAPGVDVRLHDAAGREVAPGDVGEILVRGPNVVSRYWPDQPACDADGFFHSGDLALQTPDGSYTVVGRAKDMVISGGENIYPAEIENLLAQHPAVAECAVVGQEDTRWGEVVVAVVVLRDPHTPDWDASLQAFLDGRLARYKWPRRWHRVEALPKTALGKVQKPELKAMLATATS